MTSTPAMHMAVSKPLSLPAEILRIAWQSYLQQLDTSPVLTKAVTSGALSVLSEIVARALARRPLKSSSALHELTIGLLLRGPVIHYFHMLLDRVVFAHASNQQDARIVLAKLAIDQLLFAPVFISAYLYLSGMMVDVPLAVTTRRIKKELLSVLKSNWVVWVPANFIGYYFVPLQLRVAWGSIIGVAWTAFLIAKTSRNLSATIEDSPVTESSPVRSSTTYS